jgi:putative endonuclease
MKWFLYIAVCADNSLYTGITTDLARREKQHNSRKGAKSLLGKLPIKIIYSEKFDNQSQAAERESAIKSWKRKTKMELIEKTGLSL